MIDERNLKFTRAELERKLAEAERRSAENAGEEGRERLVGSAPRIIERETYEWRALPDLYDCIECGARTEIRGEAKTKLDELKSGLEALKERLHTNRRTEIVDERPPIINGEDAQSVEEMRHRLELEKPEPTVFAESVHECLGTRFERYSREARGEDNLSERGADDESIEVLCSEYDGFINSCERLEACGYDVRLVYRCEKCAAEKHRPLLEFGIKAEGDTDYAVSYPSFCYEFADKRDFLTEEQRARLCDVNEYRAVSEFLCGGADAANNIDARLLDAVVCALKKIVQ